jgi:hypothetical protein
MLIQPLLNRSLGSRFQELITLAPGLLACAAQAETTSYGGFRHYSEVQEVLFLTGDIEVNDSFELRRAMRDQSIKLVVAASPGGSL